MYQQPGADGAAGATPGGDHGAGTNGNASSNGNGSGEKVVDADYTVVDDDKK